MFYKKFAAIFGVTALLFSSAVPTFAAEYTTATDADVPLSFSKDSMFTVTLPEAISGGSNTSVDFDYSVEGDIAADDKVTVNVEDSNVSVDGVQLQLSDTTGKTKDANISIPKTDFAYNEITAKNTQTGSVSVDNLTAGSWSGVAKFVIGMDDACVHNYTSEVTKEVGCTEDGVMTYTCNLCGDTYTEAIPKSHNYVNHVCTRCHAEEPGLYDSDGTMICTWADSGIKAGNDYGTYSGASNSYETTSTSGYYVLTNKYPNVSKVVLPDDISRIGAGAFEGCSNLTSVVIPSSVTRINACAFSKCTNLRDITIPSSVTFIASSVFDSCTSLTEIVIPDGVMKIDYGLFKNCTSLSSVTISANTSEILDYAFYGCTNLSNFDVPDGVISIGSYSFKNVPHITYHGSATGSPWGAKSIN